MYVSLCLFVGLSLFLCIAMLAYVSSLRLCAPISFYLLFFLIQKIGMIKIYDQSKDIGVMLSLGMRTAFIRRAFFEESVVVIFTAGMVTLSLFLFLYASDFWTFVRTERSLSVLTVLFFSLCTFCLLVRSPRLPSLSLALSLARVSAGSSVHNSRSSQKVQFRGMFLFDPFSFC